MGMQRGLKLAHQLIALVSIPMVFQLGLLARVSQLQNDAEKEAEQAVHATLISRSMQKLQKDLTAFAAENLGERPLRKHQVSDLEFQEEYNGIGRDYEELDKLLVDAPRHQGILRKSQQATMQAVRLIKEARESYDRAPEEEYKMRRRIFERLRPFVAQILSDDVINVGREFDSIVEMGPQRASSIRKQTHDLLIFWLGLNFVLSGLLALFVISRITGRLKIVNNNAYLFAAGKPLAPELKGADELAELDQSFHSMVSALEQSMHRQKVVVENALDMILTVNAQGRISTTNKACEAVLGCSQDDLLGVYVVEMIETTDVARAQEFFDDLQQHSKEGTIQLKVKWKGRPELHTLWSARFEPKEDSFFCVIHDIEERIQAEQLRQEILAMVSHDLRSPLTTIQNALEMWQDGVLGTLTERGERVVAGTQVSCQRMLDLVNDLLDLEKIKSGMMPCEKEDVSVSKIMTDAVQPLQEWALGRGVKIECQPVDATISGDERKLVRVIANLLGNAVKFSPSGTTVRLTAERRQGELEISVADEGEGISQDLLESVFDRYRQAGGVMSGGSGLGLTICKSFVELHGGRIWAESANGKGSTFKFVVPVQPVS
jgi:PAS domain S-box-containing protein